MHSGHSGCLVVLGVAGTALRDGGGGGGGGGVGGGGGWPPGWSRSYWRVVVMVVVGCDPEHLQITKLDLLELTRAGHGCLLDLDGAVHGGHHGSGTLP